jgi:uncharacterized protein
MATFREETFNLTIADQKTLYGILHHPEKPNGALVLMFNIGLHYRVCHSRLFVRHARYLQDDGFTVARFDTTGIGYSHGENVISRAIDLFEAVQTGLFRDDALDVARFLKAKLNPSRIYLMGLCGGALTAVLAATCYEDIDGVVFIAGPVSISSELDLTTLHPFEAGILFKSYIDKVFNPKAWGRFISGKTSYKDIFNSVKVRLGYKLSSLKTSKAAPVTSEVKQEENKGDVFNRVFFEAFQKMMRSGQRILFLMPELDRATYDFDRLFLHILENYDEKLSYFSIKRVEKADHTFTQPESANEMFELSREWLADRNKN